MLTEIDDGVVHNCTHEDDVELQEPPDLGCGCVILNPAPPTHITVPKMKHVERKCIQRVRKYFTNLS